MGNNPPVFFIRDAMNLAKADEGLARAVATGPKLEMQVNEERDEALGPGLASIKVTLSASPASPTSH